MPPRAQAAFSRLVARTPDGLRRRTRQLRKRSRLLRRLIDGLRGSGGTGDGRISAGEAAGLRFNPFETGAGYLSGTRELDVQRAFAELVAPGATVIDLGAAVGFFTMIAARRTGPAGRVLAVDPLPGNVAALRHNAELNGFAHVEVRGLAVGARRGRGTLRLGRARTQGRLDHLEGEPQSVAEERIEVDLVTLDDLADSFEGPAPSVVKIDVEGAEEEVLAGGTRLLAEHRPALVIELHGTASAVAPALDRLGYDVVVLGDPKRPPASAPWSAHLVALPRPIAAR